MIEQFALRLTNAKAPAEVFDALFHRQPPVLKGIQVSAAIEILEAKTVHLHDLDAGIGLITDVLPSLIDDRTMILIMLEGPF